ncbi:MAG: hypothetical protein RL701_63, partial [Pseudomonadota bacterium]
DAFSILANGTSGSDHQQVRRSLGLAPDCDDEAFAQALVRHAVTSALPLVRPQTSSSPPRAPSDPGRAQRSTFLLRTAAPTGGATGKQAVDDIGTLLLVMRAGGLFQRRAAVLRIGELLRGPGSIASDRRKQAIEALTQHRHFDLAYEAGEVLASLPGSEGRAARAEHKTRQELAARVQVKLLAFWEGEHTREPLCELAAEERAMILPRARALSDISTRHLSALLEDTAGQISEAELRMLLTSLEQAGDPRLMPALRALLLTGPAALYEPCVRALSSIEDPRVPGLLREAFDRATRGADRLLLSAALGRYGDARGLTYARNVVQERDAALLAAALEALSEIGGTDDVARVAGLLEHPSPHIASCAVITLGRIGDTRALVPLSELRSRVRASALRGAVEDAEAAIIARAELLGEAAPTREAFGATWNTQRIIVSARARDPAWLRLRGLLYYGLSYVCLMFGAVRRATSLFEAAAALRPGWLAPVLAVALLHARRRDVAAALSAFRRALDIDRAALEADEHAISVLAMTFLRRAEAVEREGRVLIARGLVEEALSYDLRRASTQARLALSERRDAHAAGQATGVAVQR